MRILIIDDEAKARETLKSMIKLAFGLEHELFEVDGVSNALKQIQKVTPELLLLDIRLKDGSGFDLLEKIKLQKIPVIFTTAYNEYAIKAFQFAAVNYLLKPIDLDDLTAAINHVKQLFDQKHFQQKMDLLIDHLNNSNPTRKITLKTTESIHVISLDQIIFCEADGAYTNFYLTDSRKLLVSKSIGEYEALINSKDFLRTHQSFLVNMNHVIRFDKGLQPVLLTLHDYVVPVSSRKKEQVLHFLNHL